MQTLFNIINKPLGYILEFLSGIVGGNFAAAVFIFTLLINVAMLPLSIKSQRSSVQQTRIKPKLDELKKRYGDDRQKYSEAMQKMYQEEGISMSGGCLPMLIRLPIMMSIYWLILQPLTYLLHIPADVITSVAEKLKLTGTSGIELTIIEKVKQNPSLSPEIANKLDSLSFNFFGINLTEKPTFSFDIFNDFELIWLIPILAFGAQMLTSVISLVIQKKINPDAPNMAIMMLTMPLMSLFIGFTLPGGVGFYWICSSLIAGLIQAGVQLLYGPFQMLSKERAKDLLKQTDIETKQLEKLKTIDTDI